MTTDQDVSALKAAHKAQELAAHKAAYNAQELAALRGAYETLKKDYKDSQGALHTLRVEFDLMKSHLGGWHAWAKTIERAPANLIKAAAKFLHL